jgi:hypothetical protein
MNVFHLIFYTDVLLLTTTDSMTSSIKFVVHHKSTPVDIDNLFRIIYVFHCDI